MKLAKALKLKNKKLKEYKSTLMKVIQHNSYDVDNKPIYNSAELLEEAKILMADYLKLKSAIHFTSEPIRFNIFELGELKSLMNTIGNLDTKSGDILKIIFEKMDEILGYPKFDPHGSPIPDVHGKTEKKYYMRLNQCKANEKVKSLQMIHI